jgi:hypothetical protein
MRKWLFLVPLLAACDATGPEEDWTHEGVITSSMQMVTDVDQYADITCQVNGRRVQVFTGPGGKGPRCLRQYHEVREGDVIIPTHTLYVMDGWVGRFYRIRIE